MAYNNPHTAVTTAAEMSTPATGFSPSFLAHLRKAVPPAITPDYFLKSFEKYITTTMGIASTNGSSHLWVYDIPVDVKNSPMFLQCLFELKKDIESTGYRSEQNYTTVYSMKPGTYAIITQLPHTCQSYCQRDGCDIRYKSTLEIDSTACAIAICI